MFSDTNGRKEKKRIERRGKERKEEKKVASTDDNEGNYLPQGFRKYSASRSVNNKLRIKFVFMDMRFGSHEWFIFLCSQRNLQFGLVHGYQSREKKFRRACKEKKRISARVI
jgi:hypothetical protein